MKVRVTYNYHDRKLGFENVLEMSSMLQKKEVRY